MFAGVGALTSEQNGIFEVREPAGLPLRLPLGVGRRALLGLLRALAFLLLTVTLAPKHLHFVRVDLGRESVLPVLVLPLAGFQLALKIDLRSLFEILAGDFRELAEEDNAVPFSRLALFPRSLVLPRFGGGDDEPEF